MNWLLETSGFEPRVFCGEWSNLLILLYIIPNVIIVLGFLWIPINGFRFWKGHRKGLERHTKTLVWYCGVLFLCALTHVFDIVVFKWAFYNLNIVVLNLAALVILKAAYHTGSLIEDIVMLPSRQEMHDSLNKLNVEKIQRELIEIDQAEMIKSLRKSVLTLTDIIETQMWLHDKNSALKELNSMLERINSK